MSAPERRHRAFLVLGSNIDPQRHLPAACRRLAAHGRIARVSRVWESPPADGSPQANYLNAAVLLETPLSAAELRRAALPEIENALGRVRDPHDRHAARTIDIDIALFDDAILEVAGARIPDPDLLTRPFVAVPLAELDPAYVHPQDGRTLAEIAAALEGAAPLIPRDDVVLRDAV
jgi:2-amino-4-hydroxy-6-hydroxymethyldihydropteridine diphosphokinase